MFLTLKLTRYYIFQLHCHQYVFQAVRNLTVLQLLYWSFSCTLGKSFLFRTIANCALGRGLNVCLSAPTENLSSTYAHQLPMCRGNTAHSNFFIPVDTTTHSNTINWGLSDVHVLLVDEMINSKTLFCPFLSKMVYYFNKTWLHYNSLHLFSNSTFSMFY